MKAWKKKKKDESMEKKKKKEEAFLGFTRNMTRSVKGNNNQPIKLLTFYFTHFKLIFNIK